eukprot:m.1442683 g.1442683  ORF g.1442683 m.1442683 type:complete len:50 (-) comp25097_c0_seq22:1628-1777(-)
MKNYSPEPASNTKTVSFPTIWEYAKQDICARANIIQSQRHALRSEHHRL